MPLTGDQQEFVTTYILSRDFDAARRKDIQDELAALPTGKVSGDHTDLSDMLARTGRTEDPTDPGTRAEKKEAYLREIMLRDEDGLNVNQIVDAIAPPLDKTIRDLARTEITDATTAREKADIQVARDKVDQFKADAAAAQARIETELDLAIQAQTVLRGPGHDRDSLNAAMHELAELHGQHSLSHHASRHGAHTTDDEQVRRVATGYAPDDAPPVGLGNVAAVTNSGEAVTLPDVTEKGPHAVGAASRFASAEAAIQLVENLLAVAYQARARGETDETTNLEQKVLHDPDEDVIGHSAKLTKASPSGGYVVPGTTTPVPSPKGLDKSPAELLALATTKTDVIRERAQAVTIERSVRGATVVLRALPDGSFRTVTAYPDEDVTVAALRDSTTGTAVETGEDALRLRALGTAQAALTAADQDVTAKEQAAVQVGLDRDAAKQAAYTAISESIQALPPAEDGTHDALLALQKATQAHAPFAAHLQELEAAELDLINAKTFVDQEIVARQGNVAGLILVRDNMQGQVTAITATTTKNDKNQRYANLRAAQQNLDTAEEELQWSEDAKLALAAQHKAHLVDLTKALSREVKLADTMNDAHADAVTAAGAAAADDVQQKAQTNTQAMTDFTLAQQAAKDAEAAVTQAKQVSAQAQQAIDQNSAPGPSSDQAIAEEREARKDDLQQALVAGGAAFAEKKQQWQDQIDAVEQMMADDAVERARRVQQIDAERDLARAAQETARAALEKATEALDGFGDDTSSSAFKTAVELVDGLTRARDRAESTFKAIRGQYQDFKEQARMQDREDAANIELARARAEAVATEAEVAQLTAGGAPTPPELAERKALADASETARKAALDFYQAVDAARQAKATLRVVTDHTDEATLALAALKAATPPATPERIDRAQKKADALIETLQKAVKAEPKAIDLRDQLEIAMGAAEKALNVLKKA